METVKGGATLSGKEAAVLIHLACTYMADRCDAVGDGAGIVPKRHERTLEFALRKLERAAGMQREDYEYWLPEDCDGDGDLRHI